MNTKWHPWNNNKQNMQTVEHMVAVVHVTKIKLNSNMEMSCWIRDVHNAIKFGLCFHWADSFVYELLFFSGFFISCNCNTIIIVIEKNNIFFQSRSRSGTTYVKQYFTNYFFLRLHTRIGDILNDIWHNCETMEPITGTISSLCSETDSELGLKLLG